MPNEPQIPPNPAPPTAVDYLTGAVEPGPAGQMSGVVPPAPAPGPGEAVPPSDLPGTTGGDAAIRELAAEGARPDTEIPVETSEPDYGAPSAAPVREPQADSLADSVATALGIPREAAETMTEDQQELVLAKIEATRSAPRVDDRRAPPQRPEPVILPERRAEPAPAAKPAFEGFKFGENVEPEVGQALNALGELVHDGLGKINRRFEAEEGQRREQQRVQRRGQVAQVVDQVIVDIGAPDFFGEGVYGKLPEGVPERRIREEVAQDVNDAVDYFESRGQPLPDPRVLVRNAVAARYPRAASLIANRARDNGRAKRGNRAGRPGGTRQRGAAESPRDAMQRDFDRIING